MFTVQVNGTQVLGTKSIDSAWRELTAHVGQNRNPFDIVSIWDEKTYTVAKVQRNAEGIPYVFTPERGWDHFAG